MAGPQVFSPNVMVQGGIDFGEMKFPIQITIKGEIKAIELRDLLEYLRTIPNQTQGLELSTEESIGSYKDQDNLHAFLNSHGVDLLSPPLKLQKQDPVTKEWHPLTASCQLAVALYLANLEKNPRAIFIDLLHQEQKIGFRVKRIYDNGLLLRIEVTPVLITEGEVDEILLLSFSGISFPNLAIITPAEHDFECSICADGVVQGEELVRTTCTGTGHVYHRKCIDGWLATGKNSCPLCRKNVGYLLPVPM
jgi:hypothetical protein